MSHQKAVFIRFQDGPELTVQVLGVAGSGKDHTTLRVRPVRRIEGVESRDMALKFARIETFDENSGLRREARLRKALNHVSPTTTIVKKIEGITTLLGDRTYVPDECDLTDNGYKGDLICTFWDLCNVGDLHSLLTRCIDEQVVLPAAVAARAVRDVLAGVRSTLVVPATGVKHNDMLESNIFVHLDDDDNDEDAGKPGSSSSSTRTQPAFPGFVLGDLCDGEEVQDPPPSEARREKLFEELHQLRHFSLDGMAVAAATAASPGDGDLRLNDLGVWSEIARTLDYLVTWTNSIQGSWGCVNLYDAGIRIFERIEREARADAGSEAEVRRFLDFVRRVRDEWRTEARFDTDHEAQTFAEKDCDLPAGSWMIGDLPIDEGEPGFVGELRRPQEPSTVKSTW